MGDALWARTLGIMAARNKPEAQELEEEISTWLVGRGVEVRDEASMLRGGTAGIDVLVVLGGDGLMMRTARMFPDIPLLGINFGRVGFLTMVERRDWQTALEATITGQCRVQRGPTLQATVVREEQTIAQGWVINDVVLRAGPQMVEIELYIDGQFVNIYPSDGMIISTPQGSTAYSMSAGGPILTRGVRGCVIIALNPHSPIRIPLVVDEESEIDLVTVNDKPCWLYLDGNITNAPQLQRGDVVQVRRGEYTFAMILLGGMNFYEAVRSRFNFLIRPAAIPSRSAKV
jgi:NAD+ kinase